MFSRMKIGDFASLNNISVQALRYYEKIGLVKPIEIDEFTHYRYYDLEQSAQVDVIQFLQGLDFSLTEIKQMLADSDDFDLLEELIASKRRAISLEKAQLERRLDLINSFQDSMVVYEQNKAKTELEIINFPSRYILSYPIKKNIYTLTSSDYEYQLRQFKQYLLGRGFSTGDFNRVGSLMKRHDFMRESYNSQEMFIFLPRVLTGVSDIKKLPASKYAVYYCQSFEEELGALEQFKRLIKAQELQVRGDYLCEVVFEIPKLKSAERKMFIRMQVPIA